MDAKTLVKPRIPGMTQPVLGPENADAGLPLALTYLYPQGVKVFIEPASTAQDGDVYVVRLNGERVTSAIIAAGEATLRVIVYVALGKWKTPLNVLEYALERGGLEVEASAPLTVIYHDKRPGNVDRFPEEEGHSELMLEVPPDALDEGVDPDRARAGVNVRVAYPLMRAFDTVVLYCNGKTLSHAVSADEADRQLPIQMTIDEATFRAGGDNPRFELRYTVLDRVGNSPDVNSPNSASQYLYVNLDGTWYDPPIITEDPNDPDDDASIIELEKLAGKPATAQIYVSRSWLRDDEIRLTGRFYGEDGALLEHLTFKELVKNAPFSYSIPLPYAAFAGAAKGHAVFSYQRVSQGSELDRSYVQKVDIIGEPATDLLAPVLVGSGYVIDPLAVPDGVTARVEYLEDKPGDKARLLIQGAAGLGSPAFAASAFNKNHRANFLIASPVFAASHGKTVQLAWQLLRGATTQPSAHRDVTIKRIEDRDPRLPIPTIPQARNGVLDLGDFPAGAQAQCAVWPSMAVGQLRWFCLHGTDRNGNDYPIIIAQAAQVTEPEIASGLDNALPRSELAKLKPGSSLRMELKVAFDGLNDESAAVAFESPAFTVLNSPARLLEDFTGVPDQTARRGEIMETPTMQITFKSGDGECAIMPRSEIGQSFPGQIEGQVLSIGRDAFGQAAQVVEIKLKNACSRISFFHLSVNYEDSTVAYYASNGSLLGRQPLGSSFGTPVNVAFDAPGISRLELHSPTPDWFTLDTFKVDV
ncbi:hypothetical protein C1893_17795 [Pseudomonas sp. MPR-ANC1]|uniref:hypothetical protein n=1 Tax=Pseudomonas sp. MPR-ANC1 TaxID=2075548 RepID=UPI000CD0B1A8|nr:hypothetical protein [Pseudomonas sp. MPR-ANC1]POA47015.1 hypothetical protein C1893_17795 [Pseudomonas sp. MPR-ANC1]